MSAKDIENDIKKYEPLFGSYNVSERIGSGSFGTVFKIQKKDSVAGEYPAALKVISIPSNEEEINIKLAEGYEKGDISKYYDGVLTQILNEIDIMFKLKANSNIVSYEDHQYYRHDDGIGYDILIKMELLKPLSAYIVTHKMSEKSVLKLGIDMCKALEICHRNNIIHRDIKPQNIFITDNGDYKLGDFGIARTIEKTEVELSKKGTYKYMAPEVYRGGDYDMRADIYSLGTVMYCLLNDNKAPFIPLSSDSLEPEVEENALKKRFRGEAFAVPLRACDKTARIIAKAMSFNPDKRFKSALEMRRNLEFLYNNYEKYRNEAADPERFKAGVQSSTVGVTRDTIRDVASVTDDRNTSSVPIQNEPSYKEERRKRKGRIKKSAIVAVALILLVAGSMIYLTLSKKSQDKPENIVIGNDQIKIKDYDINFSQSEHTDVDGVDVLIKVKNNSDYPINAIKYNFNAKAKGKSKKNLINEENGSDEFFACGYVESKDVGYLYSHMLVDEKARSSSERKLNITSVDAAEELEDYKIPEGKITKVTVESVNKDSANVYSYDVTLVNLNEETIGKDDAFIIAVDDDASELAAAWGYGELTKDLPGGGDKVKMVKAIYDPGIHQSMYKDKVFDFKVFVIDKNRLGINESDSEEDSE